jgi:micrococcal nuclease
MNFTRKYAGRYLLVFIAVFLCFSLGKSAESGAKSPPKAQFAKVIRVIDGDTIEIEGGEKVRYIGIDTPELHHPNKAVQPFAQEAYEFNRSLVDGKNVYLVFDVQRRDRYKRLLAYVFVGETFINAKLVNDGYARVATFPPNVVYQELFLRLERKAREENRGLWNVTE